MSDTQTQQFVHAYSNLLVRAWTDPSYLKQLEADPTTAARAAHLGVKDGGSVSLVESGSSSDGDLDVQIAAWRAGDSSGKYTLYVPSKPQLGEGTGSDAVAGDSYCCCCSPCCTCT